MKTEPKVAKTGKKPAISAPVAAPPHKESLPFPIVGKTSGTARSSGSKQGKAKLLLLSNDVRRSTSSLRIR